VKRVRKPSAEKLADLLSESCSLGTVPEMLKADSVKL
jgi:hypothetical protein